MSAIIAGNAGPEHADLLEQVNRALDTETKEWQEIERESRRRGWGGILNQVKSDLGITATPMGRATVTFEVGTGQTASLSELASAGAIGSFVAGPGSNPYVRSGSFRYERTVYVPMEQDTDCACSSLTNRMVEVAAFEQGLIGVPVEIKAKRCGRCLAHM